MTTKRKSLDEQAASLPHKPLDSGGDPNDIEKQYKLIAEGKQQAREAKEQMLKASKTNFPDFSQPKQENVIVQLGKIAERNPANLNKAVFTYQKRINYSDRAKQTNNTWTEQDIKNMEEAEQKYKNVQWFNDKDKEDK